MSKLSFRARALDPAKQMPIFLAEELPDLPEYSAINRAVPQMPSGMEKEEEAEHHLQRAICTGLIIPTPEVFTTDKEFYDRNYPANYKMPRQLIHMQLFGIEQDAPEYDMDSSDEIWVEQQSKRLNLNALKFEQMMDRLEKNSGQTVVTLAEAKSLLKQDDELSIAIYDYWLNKRLKLQHPLILTVKTDTRVGASSNNPYLAFRRRTEKMQTRKNRKNDETSYEKMLRLRRDLQRARMLLEMIKEREKKKVDMLQHNIDIFERRVELKDYNGAIYAELNAAANVQRSTYLPLYSYPGNALPGLGKSSLNTENTNLINSGSSVGILTNSNNTMGLTANSCGRVYVSGSSQYMLSNNQEGNRKEKRQYKKRKLKMPREKRSQDSCMATADGVSNVMTTGIGCHRPAKYFHLSNTSPTRNDSNLDTEDDDLANVNKLGSESEEDSLFAFKRRPNCDYQRPCMRSEAWPWEVSTEEKNDYADIKYRYTLASLSYPRAQCIGFARRRLGRGGRVIIDRASTTYDELWSQLDYTIIESKSDRLKKELELKKSSNENQSNGEEEDSDGLLDDNIDMRFVSELMFHRRQQRLLEERINKEQTQTHYKQCFNNHQRTNNNHLNNTDKCMETNMPTVVVKEETTETSIGVSSADDSNEPLSSLKNKGISGGGAGGDDDDEENVNLAELSNLIKHSNATNQNQKSDMKASDKLPYICTAKDLVLYTDDDVLSSTLNDMEDVAREKSFLPKRKLPQQERLGNKRSALLNYSKVFNGIYNDWLHFRPHHNIDLSDCEKNVAAAAASTEEDTPMEENYEGAIVSSSGKVGHSVFKISLPNSQLSPPTLLQLKAPAQLLEEPDETKEEPDLSLVKDEVIVQPFPQIAVSNNNTKPQLPHLAVPTELLLPEQTKTKNILFHMQNNNIATNNGKTIGKLIPALQQMSEENKTKLNPIVYATSSAYGQKIFIQKAPMTGVTPYSTAGINIVRKEGISDETLPQYSIVKQKKNMLSTGPLLFTTGNLTQLAAQNSNAGTENIIVSNQVKHSLPTTGTENKEILNNQKKILFANLISSSVPRNTANYGDENTDSKADTSKTNIIQSLQGNESGTTIIDGTAITRYVSAGPNAEHGQKKLHMRGGKLFKMSSRPFLVTDSQQKIKLEEVDKEKTQLIDRRLSTSGTSTLPSNSYFLTPITSAVQLKTDNDNKGAVSLHGQKIKVNFLVKDGDNKALNIAQNQIVQANSGLSQSAVPSLTGDKRIIYTSVLNVKALPKNNGDASQTLEPATSNGLHVEAAGGGDSRVVKNKTILRTSLHSAPTSGAVTSTGSGLYSVNNRYNVVKISGTKPDKSLNNKTQSPNNNARSNTYAYIKPDANKNIVIVQNFNCNNVNKNENNGANRRNQKKDVVVNEDRSDSVKDNEEKFANVNGNPTIVVNDKRANNNNNNNSSSNSSNNNKTNVDNRKSQEEELSNNNDGNSEKNSSDMPTFPVKRKSINQKKTENKSKIFKESSSTDIESNENIVATSSSPKTTDQNG